MTALFLAIVLSIAGNVAASGPATQPASLDKPGWTLTFHDEFDGQHLDESKWTDHYWHGRTHSNHEQEYYAPDGYEVKDGLLHLIARPVPPESRDKTAHLPYTSGMISSHGKFS